MFLKNTCSFPYESTAFPELSEKGAYTKDRTYGQDVVHEIIAYAKARGIRYERRRKTSSRKVQYLTIFDGFQSGC